MPCATYSDVSTHRYRMRIFAGESYLIAEKYLLRNNKCNWPSWLVREASKD